MVRERPRPLLELMRVVESAASQLNLSLVTLKYCYYGRTVSAVVTKRSEYIGSSSLMMPVGRGRDVLCLASHVVVLIGCST